MEAGVASKWVSSVVRYLPGEERSMVSEDPKVEVNWASY